MARRVVVTRARMVQVLSHYCQCALFITRQSINDAVQVGTHRLRRGTDLCSSLHPSKVEELHLATLIGLVTGYAFNWILHTARFQLDKPTQDAPILGLTETVQFPRTQAEPFPSNPMAIYQNNRCLPIITWYPLRRFLKSPEAAKI